MALAISACGDDDFTQAKYPDVSLSLSPAAQTVSFDTDTVKFSIKADGDWSIVSESDFCKVSQRGGIAGTTEMYALLAPNSGTSSRTAILSFHAGNEFHSYEIVQKADPSKENTIKGPEGYKLVWNDEFDGKAISSDWTFERQPAGWMNNELQTYIEGSFDGTNVAEIENGILNINCFNGSDGKIYSARMYAKQSTGWKYGYIEAKIKLPKGRGTWPAFWMMPSNNDYNTNPWPGCGEIDIMEEVGYDAGYAVSTIHCNKYNNGGSSIESGRKYVATAESDFHVYAMDWTAEKMDFFVDGEKILSYKNDGKGTDSWPFDNNFYIILNLAWGGAWGGVKGVDESALPVQMQVDYVRVFQK